MYLLVRKPFKMTKSEKLCHIYISVLSVLIVYLYIKQKPQVLIASRRIFYRLFFLHIQQNVGFVICKRTKRGGKNWACRYTWNLISRGTCWKGPCQTEMPREKCGYRWLPPGDCLRQWWHVYLLSGEGWTHPLVSPGCIRLLLLHLLCQMSGPVMADGCM